MNKKLILILIVLFGFFIWFNCNLVKAPRPWDKTLDEYSVDMLLKPVAEIKKNFESAQQFQTKGQRAKANEQYQRVRQGLNKLENVYIPILNAKAHLGTASRLAERKEFTKSQDEFKKFMTQITAVKSKSTGTLAKDINRILINAENLNADLAGKKDNLYDQFIVIAIKLDSLVSENLK